MNDTDILNTLVHMLKGYVLDSLPLSPAAAKAWVAYVEEQRDCSRKPDINTYTITNNSPPIEPLYALAADGFYWGTGINTILPKPAPPPMYPYKDSLHWMGDHPPGYQYYVTCNNCGILYDFNQQTRHCQPTEMSDAQQQMACKPPTSSK